MGLIHHDSLLTGARPATTTAGLLLEATRVFGDSASASDWANEPIPSLGGRRPLDLWAGTPSEQERVLTILGRIEHGIF